MLKHVSNLHNILAMQYNKSSNFKLFKNSKTFKQGFVKPTRKFVYSLYLSSLTCTKITQTKTDKKKLNYIDI